MKRISRYFVECQPGGVGTPNIGIQVEQVSHPRVGGGGSIAGTEEKGRVGSCTGFLP